jgi:hypothetical protein
MAFQITEVQKALKGVDYPASKDELADHAERNAADRELGDALRGMARAHSTHQGALRSPQWTAPPPWTPPRCVAVVDGQVLGAVGVSSGSGEEDLEVARAGVAAIPGARTDW